MKDECVENVAKNLEKDLDEAELAQNILGNIQPNFTFLQTATNIVENELN